MRPVYVLSLKDSIRVSSLHDSATEAINMAKFTYPFLPMLSRESPLKGQVEGLLRGKYSHKRGIAKKERKKAVRESH